MSEPRKTASRLSWPLQDNYRASARNMRALIRPHLVDAGIQSVTASYSGSCDEGGIEAIALEPEDRIDLEAITLDLDGEALAIRYLTGTVQYSLRRTLNEMFMDLVCIDFPGFEINDGGEGIIVWNIPDDSIALEHTVFFLASKTETREY